MKAKRKVWQVNLKWQRTMRGPAAFSIGFRLSRWTDGERWLPPDVFHSHIETRFVSILLKGRYHDHVLRGGKRNDRAVRGPGSGRLYRRNDYHDLCLLTPLAWSLCLWAGPEQTVRYCLPSGTPCDREGNET